MPECAAQSSTGGRTGAPGTTAAGPGAPGPTAVKTSPVVPAHIDFGDGSGPPRAPDFGDLYHPQIGALAQARHVFLGGNDLPARWAGRSDFTVLETGFGLGHNFLATWNAWRQDPGRSQRLHYVAVDRHPPTAADLARAAATLRGDPEAELAAQLHAAWPPLTPNLHPLQFDAGRVRLLLGWGDARTLLRELTMQAEAVFLDGFAPDRNPQMWRRELLAALTRCLRIGATVATWSVARGLRDALQAEGFEVRTAAGIGGKREITLARYAPAFTPKRVQPLPVAPAAERHALVVGGGLAGAAAARGLAGLGWTCTVFDRHRLPAQEASGNPAALFHGTVHADDGPHARFNRAAALLAVRVLQPAFAAGVPGRADGLLRLAHTGTDLAAMRALLERQRLPPDWLQALDAAAASARAGLPLPGPAWWFADGGWADPAALVRHWLAAPGIEWRGGVEVQRLLPLTDGAAGGGRWALLDAAGRTLAEASTVVVASAADAPRLLAGRTLPALQRRRGQLSWWPRLPAGAPLPRCPLAGEGYALALPDGGLLFGASSTLDDDQPDVCAPDQAYNLVRLARLTGLTGPTGSTGGGATPAAPCSAPGTAAIGPWSGTEALQGRVGWRVGTDDRLPVAGAVPVAHIGAGTRLDQVRFVPRCAGLHVATALGSRGLAWAPLLGELLAGAIAGTPLPLEADLQAAIDPARALVRAARRAR